MLFWLLALLSAGAAGFLLARRLERRSARRVRPAPPTGGHLREIRLTPLARTKNPLVAAAAVSIVVLSDGQTVPDALRVCIETDIIARLEAPDPRAVVDQALAVVREMNGDRIAVVDEAAVLFNACLTREEKAGFLRLLEEAPGQTQDRHNGRYFLDRLRRAIGSVRS